MPESGRGTAAARTIPTSWGFPRRTGRRDTGRHGRRARRAPNARCVRVCRSGLDVTELQRQVLAALRAADDGRRRVLRDRRSRRPCCSPAPTPRTRSPRWPPMFLDNEFGGRDVNTFADAGARPRRTSRSLDTATRERWWRQPALPRHHASARARRRAARRPGRRRALLGLPVPAPRGRPARASPSRRPPRSPASARTRARAAAGRPAAGPTTGDPAAPGVVLLTEDSDVLAVTPRPNTCCP